MAKLLIARMVKNKSVDAPHQNTAYPSHRSARAIIIMKDELGLYYHPQAGNAANDATSLPAYQALADHLLSRDGK